MLYAVLINIHLPSLRSNSVILVERVCKSTGVRTIQFMITTTDGLVIQPYLAAGWLNWKFEAMGVKSEGDLTDEHGASDLRKVVMISATMDLCVALLRIPSPQGAIGVFFLFCLIKAKNCASSSPWKIRSYSSRLVSTTSSGYLNVPANVHTFV